MECLIPFTLLYATQGKVLILVCANTFTVLRVRMWHLQGHPLGLGILLHDFKAYVGNDKET